MILTVFREGLAPLRHLVALRPEATGETLEGAAGVPCVTTSHSGAQGKPSCIADSASGLRDRSPCAGEPTPEEAAWVDPPACEEEGEESRWLPIDWRGEGPRGLRRSPRGPDGAGWLCRRPVPA